MCKNFKNRYKYEVNLNGIKIKKLRVLKPMIIILLMN